MDRRVDQAQASDPPQTIGWAHGAVRRAPITESADYAGRRFIALKIRSGPSPAHQRSEIRTRIFFLPCSMFDQLFFDSFPRPDGPWQQPNALTTTPLRHERPSLPLSCVRPGAGTVQAEDTFLQNRSRTLRSVDWTQLMAVPACAQGSRDCDRSIGQSVCHRLLCPAPHTRG